jgi:hypothetical protein
MTVPTITPTDTARTRRTDPIQSHMAGDRSQVNVKLSSLAVLRLVLQEGELSGSQINALYAVRQERNGWPRVAVDTPRKRSSGLCRDGLIEAVDYQKGIRCLERVFRITEQGKRELGIA